MGSRSNTPSSLQPNPSLPARPPPSNYSPAPIRNNILAFAPRSVARAQAVSAEPSMMASQATGPGGYYANSYQQQNSYYQQPGVNSYPSTAQPQIVNPFAAPGQGGRAFGSNYDPEYEEQVAQWQSAYISKDDGAAGKKGPAAMGNANVTPLGTRASNPTPANDANSPTDDGANGAGANGKRKQTVVRHGGGKTWTDDKLLEWNPAHPRLFIGNLAGEVTDDSLFKAFSKYPSVSKARVVRDGRTTKSKGFGFVSFSNTDDYFSAAKEMNGKYIGSHPVSIKRANTEIRATVPSDKKKHGKHGKNGGGGGGANKGAGVQKPQQKKEKSMKILG